MRFPKKIRYIFALIWLQQDEKGNPASRFIIKGPRGGGKSKILGALGFVQWYLQLHSVVDMGGSLQQAQGVYNYFTQYIFAQNTIVDALPDDPTMKETKTEEGNYFRAVAASPKAVRGPHPNKLYIDEACETKNELILDAMPMVNSSENAGIIATSTFHKIFGWFQETWDMALDLGWVRLSWDSFDVCKSFDPKIWQDQNLRRQIPDLSIDQAGENSLEYRAAGRTGDPQGWIPIENLIQAWREKASLAYFDVEFMGSRPSAEGMVNDPVDVDACVIDSTDGLEYVRNADTAGGLDWGFQGMTAWEVGMKHKDQIVALQESRTWSQVRSGLIIEDIVADVIQYRLRILHADHSHPFENADLRAEIAKTIRELPEEEQFRCTVVEVPFGRPMQIAETDKTARKKEVNKKLGTEKDVMLGNYRTYFSRRLLRIPNIFKIAIWQHKRYRYQKNSDKPLKEDDHHPDATMLMLKAWPLGKLASPVLNETKEPTRASTHTGGLMNTQF